MKETMTQDSESIRSVLNSNELTLLDGVGVTLFTAVAVLTHGVWGIVAGGLVLLIAAVATGPAAFVAAHLWAVAFLPQERLLVLAATQIAVFPLLVSGVTARMSTRTKLAPIAVAYVGALTVVWALVSNQRWLWQSALLFVTIAGGLSYAMHRYERVALGLVETEKNQ